jgi:alkylmercury lyase
LSIAFRQGIDAEGYAPLFRQLLLLLANGEPVSPEDIAVVSGLSRDEVVAFLPQLPNVELDDEGNLVGMGLTLRPTPNRFEVEGHSLFTWCALDALTFPFLLGKPAHVESPCPVTGTLVKVFVTPDGMEYVEPPGAVVSIVIPAATADIRGSFCDQVHFFASVASASEWLAQRPGAMVLPADQAYQLGYLLSQGLFSQNIEAAAG